MTDARFDAAVRLRALKTALLATSLLVTPIAAMADDTPAVSLGLTYTGDVWANTTGGIRRDEQYLDNLDITAAIDAEKAFNIPGG